MKILSVIFGVFAVATALGFALCYLEVDILNISKDVGCGLFKFCGIIAVVLLAIIILIPTKRKS